VTKIRVSQPRRCNTLPNAHKVGIRLDARPILCSILRSSQAFKLYSASIQPSRPPSKPPPLKEAINLQWNVRFVPVVQNHLHVFRFQPLECFFRGFGPKKFNKTLTGMYQRYLHRQRKEQAKIHDLKKQVKILEVLRTSSTALPLLCFTSCQFCTISLSLLFFQEACSVFRNLQGADRLTIFSIYHLRCRSSKRLNASAYLLLWKIHHNLASKLNTHRPTSDDEHGIGCHHPLLLCKFIQRQMISCKILPIEASKRCSVDGTQAITYQLHKS
jgi:hypothetical protein